MRYSLAIFTFCLLILSTIGPAWTQSDEQTVKEKIKSFEEDYEFPENNAAAIRKSLDRLNGLDHPKVIKLLVSQVIPKELKRDNPLVINRIVEILGQVKSDQTIAELIKAAKKKPAASQLIVIRAMGRIKHPDITDRLLSFINDKKPALRIAAIQTLANSRPADATTAVIAALPAEEWPVRSAAINYLARLTDDPQKETIIKALRTQAANESGRLKNDIDSAIKSLSKSAAQANQDNATQAMFYGMPINSKNLVFVVDTSGSMLRAASEENKSSHSIMGQSSSKKNKKRIVILRKELMKAVENLPPDASFNIITFNNQADQWQPKLVPVKKYKDKALDWIRHKVHTLDPNNPIGNTNLYSGLEKAFELARPGKAKGILPSGYVNKKGLDTIYLMSDGFPDKGLYIKPEEILAAVKTLNQTLQLKINTISVGIGKAGAPAKFMRDLAEQNNGTNTIK